MRDHIELSINGEPVKVRGQDAFLTLSEYLRTRRRLTGTKIVCAEGDCGSCSVLCGKASAGSIDYLPIDSCIRFMFQLDGMHVITVEGLRTDGHLTAVQQAMVDCHGSQCGFCTPGFVMVLAGMCRSRVAATEEHLRRELSGNLCRCTGYRPILEAGRLAAGSQAERPALSSNGATSHRADTEPIDINAEIADQRCRVHCPATIQQAVTFLNDHPRARIVAGATDLGVQFNKGQLPVTDWLDLNRIVELQRIEVTAEELTIGALATWSQVEQVVEQPLPEFHAIIRIFGSPQIRHVGTIGGNIINASPISDAVPLLLVSEAELTLVSLDGERTMNINEFYRGYKDFDLRQGELLTQIRVPLPPPQRHLRLYKVSRRRDMDISSFTGAIWVELEEDTIVDAGLAYGAVGPVVLRLRRTETFLRGKPFDLETMHQAGEIAVDEIAPISDVRGEAAYRRQLARNVLRKFYYQIDHQSVHLSRRA